MELFAAFAGLAPARGGQAVALAWKGLRPDAGCSMRFRARRGGGLSAAAAAVGEAQRGKPKGTLESEIRIAMLLLGQRPPRHAGL